MLLFFFNNVKEFFSNIVHSNCDCLSKTKLTDLNVLIKERNIDIILLTEFLPKNSQFVNDINLYKILVVGYNSLYPNDIHIGSGALLVTKKGLPVQEIELKMILKNLYGAK